jgi:pyruvate dehydrogenase E2 component (dihydrolipoamide acetyltransferase)
VLIHGFGGDLSTWIFNQAVLAAARPVIALDLPGHGASSKDVRAGDVPALADIIQGLLDTLGIARAHLAGHSLGGAVALELALSDPQRVVSLSLLAPAGLSRDIDVDYIATFIAANRRKAVKEVLARLVHDPEQVSRDMVENLLRYKRTDGVTAALTAIAATVFDDGGQSMSYGDFIADVAVPILCLWGAEDAIIPLQHTAVLPDGAEVHVLDNAGHLVQMEQASKVNNLIDAFVVMAD